MAGTESDYVVVGSGASGAVFANRLSTNPAHSVLRLEPGGADTRKNIQEPWRVRPIVGSDVDWNFSTEP